MDFFMLWDFLISSFAWVYRGWLYIFSETYRYMVKEKWRLKDPWFKYVDITGSVLFMVIEVYIILLYAGIVGNFAPPI